MPPLRAYRWELQRQIGACPKDSKATHATVTELETCRAEFPSDDVFGYPASGYSLKAISTALRVSQNTVKTHATSIYRKTGVRSRQETIELVNPTSPQGMPQRQDRL